MTVAAASSSNKHDVFINCPFDDDYVELLRPLLFTVVHLGFVPRLASERSDSAEYRLDKICELIEQSSYSIHDLSRLKSESADEFARMNMPFELGIDWGWRRFGDGSARDKKFLVLETNPHDFKIALSDLSGIDIKNHRDQPYEMVRAVRDWFYETVEVTNAPSPTELESLFENFMTDLFEERLAPDLPPDKVREDIRRMPIAEYINSLRDWTEASDALSPRPGAPSAR